MDAVENAIGKGLTVVVSAGDDGLVGTASALASIESPGTAPNAITVGAMTNSHVWYQTVTASGKEYNALFGTGPLPGSAITGPLKDTAKLGDDGYLCSSLGGSGLNGSIALVARGVCALDTKIYNAANAGATAVIIYQGTSNGQPVDSISQMTSLGATGIPAVLVGNTDGNALKTYATGSNPQVTLDPAWLPFDATSGDMAGFSSRGPSIGDSSIKPEVVGVGTDLYTATQNYDPNGDLFNSTRYAVANGTSFSAALAAGVAALVKQAHPSFIPVDIKSALVNTANSKVSDFDSSGKVIDASVTAMGAGKLDAAQAVQTNVTVYPTTVSLGALTNSMQNGQKLGFCNWSNNGINLNLTAQPKGSDPGRVTVNPSAITLAPNGCVDNVTLVSFGSAVIPAAGSYEGVIAVNGGAVALRIPYLYIVSDNNPVNFITLRGYDFVATPGSTLALTVKATDQFGVGLNNVQMKYAPADQLINPVPANTDALGIIEAQAMASSQLGESAFTSTLLNNPTQGVSFFGRVRLRPSISVGGVVNAASNQQGQGIAPGSMVSIYGTGFAESAQQAYTVPLPLSLLGVSVSFDTATKSYPARIIYSGLQQMNVQVPWELAGETSVQLNVGFGETFSPLYTAQVNTYSPAVFEHVDGSGNQIAAAQNDAYQDISTTNPAQKGQAVILYSNGLGPVQNQPGTGEASPGSPSLAYALHPPTAKIGGVDATVQFAGLTPGFVALYQVNVVVPPNVASGAQPVVLTSNGISSKAAILPIR